jgi:putative phage-type endonuclease
MRIINIDQNSAEWLEARKGKITGSKLGSLVVKRGTGKKLGFYELLAERLAESETDFDETAIERGHRLEDAAVELFAEKTGKKVSKVGLCVHDEYEGIASSPDGLIANEEGKYTEAVEVKCLSTARHLMIHFEDKVPDEYWLQVVQYFIVNEDLETLHFVSYDPRVAAKPLHVVEVTREQVLDDVETYREYQRATLEEIEALLIQIAF